MRAEKITAILMASGFSRRMGRDKLLLPFRGGTLLSHAVELLLSVPFGQRLLVTTPERLEALPLPGDVTAICNHNPAAGQSESIRLGVLAATGEAYMFFTADQPLLDRETVTWLIGHADAEHIVYPALEGRPANPSIFPARFRSELLAVRGDRGGRAIRVDHPDALLPLRTTRREPFWDIDTEEDYAALISRFGAE